MTEKEPAVFPSGYRGDEYHASSSSMASFSSAVMLNVAAVLSYYCSAGDGVDTRIAYFCVASHNIRRCIVTFLFMHIFCDVACRCAVFRYLKTYFSTVGAPYFHISIFHVFKSRFFSSGWASMLFSTISSTLLLCFFYPNPRGQGP